MAYGLATKIAAKALAQNGHSNRSVARQLKVSPNSVSEWVRDNNVQIISQKEIDHVKHSLVGYAYRNAHRLEAGITDEKIAQANVLQLSTAFAIHIDKARLMENLSTQNVSYNGVLQNIEGDRARLMDKIKSLEGFNT